MIVLRFKLLFELVFIEFYKGRLFCLYRRGNRYYVDSSEKDTVKYFGTYKNEKYAVFDFDMYVFDELLEN